MTRPLTRAAFTGAFAAALSLGAWGALGAEPGPFEWWLYDRWLAGRVGARAGSVVVVVRDAASDTRYGAGPWDAALIARLITTAVRGSAAAIGVDARGAAARGGPASEALLAQATALAGDVVYAVAGEPPPAAVQRAKAVGHALAPAEADGVIRRVPLFAQDARRLPAFGLAVIATGRNVSPEDVARRVPTDPRGRALIDFAAAPTIMSFADLDDAVGAGRLENNVLILLTERAAAMRPTPVGAMSEMAVQAQLAATLAGGDGRAIASGWWLAIGTLALAVMTAWLTLARRPWIGLLAVGALAALAVAAVPAVLRTGTVVVAWPALAAVALAFVGGLVGNRLAADDRIRHLEEANARARDELMRRESAVEALEEDLDAARAAIARSTGAERELTRAAEMLTADLMRAREQEERSRARVRELETALGGGRPPARAADATAATCEALGIATRDPALLALFRDLEKAARSTLPVLLVGEPGTGKELFARAAHQLSPRAGRPFVAVNMAAIAPDLFESELFGHVRGAFTGAAADRKGLFEQADGGTIFLDEVGDVRVDHQSKLLRVLQEKTFYRVGATKPTVVDVRVVAATNRDLERGIAQGWFREDLYFRLKGLMLRLPPLRARSADVPLLAERLVQEAASELRRPGVALSDEAHQALSRYSWPGNVRELQHCLRQAVTLTEGPLITAADLRLPSAAAEVPGPVGDDAVLAALRRHGFDMQATARELGCDRSTVTQRLKGLGFRALVEAGVDHTGAAMALAADPALARAVEVKLREYHDHLLRSVSGFESAEAAVAACRRRFKNLPDRHFGALETLVRRHFDRQ